MDITSSGSVLLTPEDVDGFLQQPSLLRTDSLPWDRIQLNDSVSSITLDKRYVSKDMVENVIHSEFCLEMCPYSSIKDCQNNSKICLKKNILNKLDVC